MAKRKELKNIMIGIVSSLISRNNDVNGYWGFGKIYGFMLEHKISTIKIDLLNRTMSPHYEEFDYRLNFYADKLVTNVEKRLLNMSNVREATIYIKDVNLNELLLKATIKDDLNRVSIMEEKIYCYPHAPSVESKSTREYSQVKRDTKK